MMVGNNETWYYSKTPLMPSMLGGIVGDSAVWRAQSATLDFGGRAVRKITLDPFGRFPDKDTKDNVWPR
jgi:hypothetical protein